MGCRWCPLQLFLLAVWVVLLGTGSSEHPVNAFTIQHEKNNTCLKGDGIQLTLTTCSETDDATFWIWGSNHRLFNLGSQKCLGIDLLNSKKPLVLTSCDSKLTLLYWRCEGGEIYGAAQYRLSVKDGAVTASLTSDDTWRRGSSTENICQVPYQVIYTTGGNSNGARCEFPFLHDGQWHHDCITDGNSTRQWCATSADYTSDQKWGLCLKAVNGCGDGWIQDATLQTCYQFNTQASLKWKEAYESCLSQGADLLSISGLDELINITSNQNLPEAVWIGLNRFDNSGGWQWSDGTPLNFINWNQEKNRFSHLEDSDCGVLNTGTGLWQNQHCGLSFPFICKKKIAEDVSEPLDYWVYSETQCDTNWIPYNGFCYVLKEQGEWENADFICKQENGSLISLHSLADIEMVVTKFDNESGDIWSGFRSNDTPAFFKWSDGEETDFTYWDLNEPNTVFNSTSYCVSVSVKSGRWHVRLCNETLKYVCKKNGTIVNDTLSDNPCSKYPNSKRHGDFCYYIEKDEVLFGTKCNLTVTNNFEQEFINSLLRKEPNIKDRHFWTGLRARDMSADYFWQTPKGNKYLTFSNWKPFEPALPGGCAVITTGEYFGKWAVKDCTRFRAQSICKHSIGPAKPDEPPEPSLSCAEGWFNGSTSYCYKLFHYERLLRMRTWEEAEGFCEEFGANLASFSHEEELKEFRSFLKSMVSDSRWIWTGLNKRNVALQGSWEWSDGRPISSAILPNEFEEEDYELRDCVAIQINQPVIGRYRGIFIKEEKRPEFSLKPFHCEAALEWVCQIPRGAVMKTPVWYQTDVTKLYGTPLIYEGEEYWIVSDKYLTFKEAALYCASYGAELATLDSYQAVDAVKKRLSEETKKQESYFLKWWVKSTSYKSHTELLLHYYLGMSLRDCSYISTLPMFSDRFSQVNCNQRMPFICENKNQSLLEINSTKSQIQTGSCPKNWTSFRDKCFLEIKSKYLTFNDANEECRLYGGTLPTILSQSEQDFIIHLLPSMASQLWIGLRLPLETGRNKWIDNQEVTYVNFHPILQGRFKMFAFDPLNEERTYKKKWTTGLYLWGFLHPFCCVDNWAPVSKDKCFLEIKSKYLTFNDANEECRLYGGTLPTILSQSEQDFIIHLLPSMASQLWIGLRLPLETGRNKWIDNQEVTYVNFHPILQGRFKMFAFDPLNEERNKQCFYILNDPASTFAGTWDFTSCAEKQNVSLCQKYKGKDGDDVSPNPVPEDLTYNGYRYKILQTNLTWYEALEQCNQYNMSMASITNQYQLAFLSVQVRILNHSMWIGLSSQDDGVHYRWQNGKPVSVNRWSHSDGQFGDCVYIDTDGFWKTAVCGTELLGAFCYLAPDDEVEHPVENTKSCPHRIGDAPWIPFRNSCYTFLVSHKRWLSNDTQESRHVCRALHPDAFVLSIRDEAENMFIFNQLSPFRDLAKFVWLGITYDRTEKKLHWHDQTFVKYSNWRMGRPKVVNNGFYSAMGLDGFWDVYNNPSGFEIINLQQHSIVACKIELDAAAHYKEPLPAVIHYEDMLYNVVQKKLTWNEAARECKQNGGNLASVHSEIQQGFLESVLRQDGFPLWIGLSSHDGKPSSYEWSDGSQYDYIQKEFTQLEPTGNCVFMDTKGFWRTKNCTDFTEGAVCFKPATPLKLDTDYPVCPYTPKNTQWILQSDFCYGFDAKMYNFSLFTKEEAAKLCHNLDPTSTLLTIYNAEENNFVTKYLKADPFITRRIWLGLNLTSKDIKSQGSAQTAFTNWNNEKNEADGQCAVLLPTDGTWHKVSCESGEARVVCKAPLRTNRKGLAIALAAVVIFLLVVALAVYCYKKRSPSFFSSVRYKRAEEDFDKQAGWDVELL
ncbi:Hypothetical predicted protein [Pelobates cultripes]|uniref:Lymphocyte antigen 75 n=1 Tax=Pelobates cultripes TaxID=61616 RepID=A0AAD1SM35_PELCU|nr:Hypothetical predicted protein [Pelobates cultripes]